MVDAAAIELAAKETLGFPASLKWESKDKDTRFRSCFGASSKVVAQIWNLIEADIDEPGAKPKHLLWAFAFMEAHSVEDIHRAIVGWPSAKAFRKWSWCFAGKTANLKDEVICLDNRFRGNNMIVATNCFMSADGTDCPVFEPRPFDTKMFSKKLNGPGLKCEVGIGTKSGDIVWISGPFKCGKGDDAIFKEGLEIELADDECAEVDSGCRGTTKGGLPDQGMDSKERKEKSVVRGRHEVVNGRLKVFAALTAHFRHMGKSTEEMMAKHKLCFHAIAVITQLKFDGGETAFDADCNVSCF